MNKMLNRLWGPFEGKLGFEKLDHEEALMWTSALNEFGENHLAWLQQDKPDNKSDNESIHDEGIHDSIHDLQLQQIQSALKHGNILRLMRYVHLAWPGPWTSFENAKSILNKL